MLTLRSGASSLVVAPEHGAGITGWMIGRTPLLRRALPQTAIGDDPHAMGCFPLLPYGNRIGFHRFRWQDRDYTLADNFPGHPHTIHGVGWQLPWTIAGLGPASVTLTLEHRPDAADVARFWPFAFDAQVAYRLTEAALTVQLHLTSRHDAPAPAGIGVHPYFPKASDPALGFNATGVWQNGRDALPACHVLPPADWQHTEPRPVALSRLDNCFTGWDGRAEVHAGPASLVIEASEIFRQLQVFTPPWTDFFCVEPVSHTPNAINHPDLPPEQAMNTLAPNETLRGTIRFIPTANDRNGETGTGAPPVAVTRVGAAEATGYTIPVAATAYPAASDQIA